ncbi:hypothetical protein NVP1170O_143 [Vibrio phage 1.170.O._10N.261.52.C3]|nr:hypothetical protein NVP1170O_143 [Vibrio phage 1.170.O._10N.261.52.C3]
MGKPWEPKYFAKSLDALAKEILSPKVYQKDGVQGLRRFDQRILEFLDEFRYDVGIPLTVNTPWNGTFTQSGQRDNDFYGSYEKLFWSLSDHTRGAALDIKCSEGGHWLRKKFIEKEAYYYKKYGINFIECGPLDSEGKTMSWFHCGIRFDFFGNPVYWSPELKYVSKEKVLKDGL